VSKIVLSFVLGLSVVCFGAAEAEAQGAGADHTGHEMTPEMFDEIREKIAVYKDYSDERIMQDMKMMPNFDVYVSAADVVGDTGILALTHGFRDPLNAEFEAAMTSPAEKYPTAVGYGMAMMSSSHIQSSIDKLEAAGAKRIVVLPVTTLMHSRMLRQWDYIFGRRDEPEYVSVPRVQTDADIFLAETPTEDPILSTIMLDHALELSRSPEEEVLILVSHGATFIDDNEIEQGILEKHADRIADNSDFSSVNAVAIQDDAPDEIRDQNVNRMRGWVEEATADGKRAILVTNLILLPSFVQKLDADLAGLEYQLSSKGVMQHPAMAEWIDAMATKSVDEM
jgi:hypothetical protein